ncbi:MAG: hypothetical protein ACYTGN_02775 [Planctomycetota bacterium]|jgi:quinol-cytochrome oxidoreductase complex cytochrome b subunit
MIVLVRPDADTPEVEALMESVRKLGLDLVPLDDRKERGFEVVGSDRGLVLSLRGSPAVAEILTRRRAVVGGEPLWPHFALRLAVLCTLLVIVLVLLAAFSPALLTEHTRSGSDVRQVEWFLRPIAGFLALFSADLAPLGGALILAYWATFMLWPFLDRADTRTARGRRVARLILWMGVLLFLLLVALGVRGAA